MEHIKKYVFKPRKGDKEKVADFLLYGHGEEHNGLIEKYCQLISPYLKDILKDGQEREEYGLASGIIFFYGCLLFIAHFDNWIQYLDDIVQYNILYLLVDHYIDDTKEDPTIKQKSIKQMHILIKNPEKRHDMKLIDSTLYTIAEVYEKLITKRPKSKKYINQLFNSQIQGLKIQNSKTFEREQYMKICENKGGYTLQVLIGIVDRIDLEDEAYHIGTIMQYIDDSVDCLVDQDNKIYTIATHDLEKDGNIDKLWVKSAEAIKNISGDFFLFKVIYSIFLIYIPSRIYNCYGEQIIKETSEYNFFDYKLGVDGAALLEKQIKEFIIKKEL